MDPTVPETGAPQTIGRYIDLHLLGRGGMGAVYRGYDPELDRPVAIKVMLHSTPDFVARFRREAQVIARLTHANVVQVYDFGVDTDNNPYFVMELVEGTPLDALLRERGALSGSTAGNIARQAAHGLAAAHRAGIIHRDIKPSNLIIDARGNVKLVDFGIARSQTGAALTQAASLMGTPGYMAPEQAQGKSVDLRADIYALGLTLFEMVSGEPPFSAEDPIALVVMNMQQPLPNLRERGLELPESMIQLIERMGEKAPENRPQNCEEVVRLIDEIIGVSGSMSFIHGVTAGGNAAGTGSVPPTNLYPASAPDEPARGRRGLAWGLGAMLAVSGIGIGILLLNKPLPIETSPEQIALAGSLGDHKITPATTPSAGEKRIQNTANAVPLANSPEAPKANAPVVDPGARAGNTGPLRVAVLKFQNLSKDATMEGMTLGIGETLVSKLAGTARGRAELIERSDIDSDIGEIDRAKDEHFDTTTTVPAGKLEGVHVAVQGGFQRVGRNVRITARFVRVQTGEILDTLHVDGRKSEVFDMQDKLAVDMKNKLVALVDKERPQTTIHTGGPDTK